MAIYEFSLKNKADLTLNRVAVVREFREITGYGLKATMDIIYHLEHSDFVVVELVYSLQKHPSRAEFFDVITQTTLEDSSEAEDEEQTFTEGQILAAYKEFANDISFSGAYSFVAFLKKHIDPEYQEYKRLKEKFGE